MEELIYTGFGVDILKRNGKFYIRADAGELVIKMKETEITEEESIKAQKSEKDAYEVLVASERRESGKK